MLTVSHFRNAAFLLCFGVTVLRAEGTDKRTAPPTVELKTWHFEADLDRRSSVTLFPGETPENVIRKMGEPRGRSKKKNDPINQELRYLRKTPGPLVQKQATTRDGSRTYRYQVVFTDEITLYFKNGTLQNVKTYRTRSDDSGQDSLPPFMR